MTKQRDNRFDEEVSMELIPPANRRTASLLFQPKPDTWGGRGDPYLWEELEQLFSAIPLPCERTVFIDLFETYFQKITNHPFTRRGDIFVEQYDHGGMSSGMVSMEFWRKRGLPLLLQRLEKENLEG